MESNEADKMDTSSMETDKIEVTVKTMDSGQQRFELDKEVPRVTEFCGSGEFLLFHVTIRAEQGPHYQIRVISGVVEVARSAVV